MRCEVCGAKRRLGLGLPGIWDFPGKSYLWQCPVCTTRGASKTGASSDSGPSQDSASRRLRTETSATPRRGEALSQDHDGHDPDGQQSKTTSPGSADSSRGASTTKRECRIQPLSEESLHDLRAAEGELATALYRVRRLLRREERRAYGASWDDQEEDEDEAW